MQPLSQSQQWIVVHLWCTASTIWSKSNNLLKQICQHDRIIFNLVVEVQMTYALKNGGAKRQQQRQREGHEEKRDRRLSNWWKSACSTRDAAEMSIA
jgi:hypothetical protein